MKFSRLILTAICVNFMTSSIAGKCRPDKLPRGLCARVYEHSFCEGRFYSVYPGDLNFLPTYFEDEISSFVLNPECRIQVFDWVKKTGSSRTFKSGMVVELEKWYRNQLTRNTWNDAISSISCQCGRGIDNEDPKG